MTLTNNTIKLAGVATDPLLDLNTYPSLDLQFATTKTLNDEVSGTPLVDHQRSMSGANATPGTFVNSSGLIETSKVNLLKYSEQFQTIWSTLNLESIAATSNTETSPYGTVTADKIVWTNAATSGGYVAQLSTNRGTATNPIVVYTLTGTGTATIVSALAAGSNYDIDPVGNGWYRCWLYDSTAGQTLSVYAKAGEFDRIQLQFYTANRYIYVRDSVATQGDGTSGVYLWGAQLEEGSTVSPYIKTTSQPSAAPRFDHNPSDNSSLGLLIEESRENFLTNSEHMDTGWIYQGSMTAPTTTTEEAPDGGLDARLFTSIDPLRVRQDKTLAAAVYTLSVYYKPNTDTTLQLYLFNNGSSANVTFDTTNPSNPTVSSGSGVMIDAGNGWFRASVTTSSATDGTAIESMIYTDSGYLWGAQLEAGSFPTSYVPTSGTTATRAADTASITGSNFTSFYNQSEGTVFVGAQAVESGTLQYLLHVYGISGTNNRGAYYLNGSNRPSAYWVNAGTTAALLQSPTPTLGLDGASFKYVAAYGTDDFVLGYDGGNLIFDTSGSSDPTINTATIGSFSASASFLNGHISRLTYYPYRLADATLQTITS